MNVLICGGRGYGEVQLQYKDPEQDRWERKRAQAEIEHLQYTLDKLHEEHWFRRVMQGGARGADTYARLWAIRRNIRSSTYKVTAAEWKTMGPKAGPIRNQKMLDEGKPDLVIAFPGGRWTEDMVTRSMNRGIKVLRIEGPDLGGHHPLSRLRVVPGA